MGWWVQERVYLIETPGWWRGRGRGEGDWGLGGGRHFRTSCNVGPHIELPYIPSTAYLEFYPQPSTFGTKMCSINVISPQKIFALKLVVFPIYFKSPWQLAAAAQWDVTRCSKQPLSSPTSEDLTEAQAGLGRVIGAC